MNAFAATWLLGALVALSAPAYGAEAAQLPRAAIVQAQFRGCESARVCRFFVEASALIVVRPEGVTPGADNAAALAVRDRLNALLSDMIHQHKRIELRDLRALGEGVFAATVIVNEMPLQADQVLRDLTR